MAKFAKGHAHNPRSGRPKGSPNKGTTRAKRLIADADDEDIVKQTVAAAKTGDIAAQQLYYRFLRPPRPRLNPTPVEIPRPTTIEDVRNAGGDLVIKTLVGELDMDAATVAAALLKAVESSIVGSDLEGELAALREEIDRLATAREGKE
jgi:hypothetical protein